MTKTDKILNIIYGFTVSLFLLDCLSSLDIKSQILKSSVYFGILIGTPLTLIWNTYKIQTRNRKFISLILPISMLILILLVGPFKILHSIQAWRTQTILYENGHFSFKTVEFQMQDNGAFGYNKRMVEVYYLTPLIMITNSIPNNIEQNPTWIKVDKEVNELELK